MMTAVMMDLKPAPHLPGYTIQDIKEMIWMLRGDGATLVAERENLDGDHGDRVELEWNPTQEKYILFVYYLWPDGDITERYSINDESLTALLGEIISSGLPRVKA